MWSSYFVGFLASSECHWMLGWCTYYHVRLTESQRQSGIHDPPTNQYLTFHRQHSCFSALKKRTVLCLLGEHKEKINSLHKTLSHPFDVSVANELWFTRSTAVLLISTSSSVSTPIWTCISKYVSLRLLTNCFLKEGGGRKWKERNIRHLKLNPMHGQFWLGVFKSVTTLW